MARRRGLHGEDVEDATQRSFVAILESIGRYEPVDGKFDAWAKTIARRAIRDYVKVLRNRPDQVEGTDAADPVDPGPDSEDRMKEAQEYVIFLALLDVLPDELREVLVMADQEEIPMPVIAKELGISLEAGYSRLRRARRALEIAWNHRQSAAAPIPVLALGAVTLDQLMAIDRTVPPLDPDMKADIWARLNQSLGPEVPAGTTAGTGSGVGRGLVGFATKKVAGAALIFGLGMGAGALLHKLLSDSPDATPSTVVSGAIPSVEARGGAPVSPSSIAAAALGSYADPLLPKSPSDGPHAAPIIIVSGDDLPSVEARGGAPGLPSSASLAVAAPGRSTGAAHKANVDAGAPTDDDSIVAERALIQEARAAVRKQQPEKALDALRRHKAEFVEPRFADMRSELLREAMGLIRARENAPDAEHP
jgi:RNA polymerase sigma factor (sigma-70 family)